MTKLKRESKNQVLTMTYSNSLINLRYSLENKLKHSAMIFDSSLPFVMHISLSNGS